tara:strand:- start:147 stop:509 length:363 start_codon:yes stop_codon:yes gene_type:complete
MKTLFLSLATALMSVTSIAQNCNSNNTYLQPSVYEQQMQAYYNQETLNTWGNNQPTYSNNWNNTQQVEHCHTTTTYNQNNRPLNLGGIIQVIAQEIRNNKRRNRNRNRNSSHSSNCRCCH